jgi:maleate isomerase
MERELRFHVPEGIVFHFNRLSRRGSGTRESLLDMIDSVDRAAHDLAQTYPEVILYGCTSGSFISGVGKEDELGERILRGTGITAFTTSTAVIRALRAVSAKRVLMITPYPDEINEHEIEFLKFRGISVEAWDSFQCPTSEDKRKVSSAQVYDMVVKHRDTAKVCDAVFVSCTNLLAMDIVDKLENELGVPVITSNQATLWVALDYMKVDTRNLGGGRLFELTAPKTGANQR